MMVCDFWSLVFLSAKITFRSALFRALEGTSSKPVLIDQNPSRKQVNADIRNNYSSPNRHL
jgi:hypothetical protein